MSAFQSFSEKLNFEVSYSHDIIDNTSVASTAPIKDVIVLAYSKDYYTNLNLNSKLCKLTHITENELNMLQLGAKSKFSIPNNSDNISHIEFTFPCGNNTEIRKFVIAVLPSSATCSRHNTLTRSHAITSFIKANKGSSNNVFVYLCTSDPVYVLGQACAVGRCFAVLNMKSKSVSTTSPPVKNSSPSLSFHLMIDVDMINNPDQVISSVPNKEHLKHLIGAIQLTQKLVDMPPNILTTTQYVHEVEAVMNELNAAAAGQSHSAEIKIHAMIKGIDLEKAGFGGIYNVGKASVHEPVFVCLSYVPAGMQSHPPVALVGKGIVYDTGGLSIKVPPGMVTMKHDMGGSAAVLGAFQAIVLSQLQVPVYAMLCIAENSIAGNAMRPDDVITMLSGKTVEVNNTDAEGRLVLADGVYYASSLLPSATSATAATAGPLVPSVIIDMATLTGAQGVATGRNHAGIYTNDEDIELLAVKVGKSTGDLVHPLPYCPEFYKNEFRSVVADMKNSVADRTNAQSSCAAQFIGNHIEDYLKKGGKWLHIDMAYPVSLNERATGYGVALLYEIVKSFQNAEE